MEENTIAVVDTSVESKLQNNGLMIVDRAKSLTIATSADYELAGQMLVEIKASTKAVKDYWKEPKSSAAAQHKLLCDKEKQMLDPLVKAEAIIKSAMVSFQAAVEKARREAEEAARKRQAEEAERLLAQAIKAEGEGNESEAAASMAMAQMVDDMRPVVSVEKPTAAGTSIRKTWKARITDPKAVPSYVNGIEVREINMSALNSLAKMTNGTIEIPGVEFYQESTLSVRS